MAGFWLRVTALKITTRNTFTPSNLHKHLQVPVGFRLTVFFPSSNWTGIINFPGLDLDVGWLFPLDDGCSDPLLFVPSFPSYFVALMLATSFWLQEGLYTVFSVESVPLSCLSWSATLFWPEILSSENTALHNHTRCS